MSADSDSSAPAPVPNGRAGEPTPTPDEPSAAGGAARERLALEAPPNGGAPVADPAGALAPAPANDEPAAADPPNTLAAAETPANGAATNPSGAGFPSFPPPGSEPLSSRAPAAPPPPLATPATSGAGGSGSPPPPASPKSAEPADEHAMTLWEHLDELRSRLVRMIVAFIAGGIAAWIYREELLGWLTEPFVKAWPAAVGNAAEGAALHFPSPASLFLAYVRLAAIGGLVFSLPFILYQLWAFIAPGLYSREKRFAAPFVISSCALFALGGWFGWRFAFPVAFQYLLGFAKDDPSAGLKIQPTVMVSEYIEFVTHMLLAFGFMCELPVLVFFLSVAGIINHRHLIKFFRYFIVVAFVIAAIVTPPDPMSQLMLAVPLVFLYGVSIGVAYVFGRKDLKPS